jgi:hypothetical protein
VKNILKIKIMSNEIDNLNHDKNSFLTLKDNIYKLLDIYWDLTTIIMLGLIKRNYNVKVMNTFLSEAVELSELILASHEKMSNQVYKNL